MDAALGPPEKMAQRRDELTPMMAQYFDICEQYDDSLVLFQVGDFYEAFCEAARTVARTCEVTLTRREDSTGEYAMAGLPVDSAESYVERLLGAGYRVAIADQVEDPEEATGVVDRAVTRILTPGTLTEDELLEGDRNNYVTAVVGGERWAFAVLDVSTGDFYTTSATTPSTVRDELSRFDPAEALLGPEATDGLLPDGCLVSSYDDSVFDLDPAREQFETYFGSADHHLTSESEMRACGALLSYAEYVRGGERARLGYLNHLVRYDPEEYMLLDAVALHSLELFERRTVGGHEDGTLTAVLDETASAPGRRKLDDWLRRPLLDCDAISRRHDAVGALRDDVATRETVHTLLEQVYDIERLISRIARGRANARDLRSLKDTLDIVPAVRETLAGSKCETLDSLRERLDPLESVRDLIEGAIQENPAREITEGGIIKPDYDERLRQLRETERDGKAWVDSLQETERERTGIDSLKVGHNSVHGYYIEVTDANLDSVPDDYERRQTLKNAERYYTPALKEREDEIFRAAQLADQREYELFCQVRAQVGNESERVQAVADALAELDVFVSFATVAAVYGYTRPVVGRPPTVDANTTVNGDTVIDGIHIEDGRHPVVERTEESFVPNGTHLDSNDRFVVLTGPNMSGKSTYMRQVALISVLAQSGSFVPASEARLQVVGRIFTRIGASDDIAGGRSTFMVEMTELSEILDHATPHSLVLLDEVGRGTSTADGYAIAQAVTEYLHDESRALTLFATHHHDLTAVADELDGAYNLYFRTQRTGDAVCFEHAVERGTADASYGVEVAATAGVRPAVVERARDLLEAEHSWEDSVSDETHSTDDSDGERSTARALRAALEEADVATMTPLEALNLLAELKQQSDISPEHGPSEYGTVPENDGSLGQ